jgi:hypothetical protein
MALKTLPFHTAGSAIRRFMSRPEDEETTELIRSLRAARKRGYLRRSELEAICYWKSPRAIQHIRSNTVAAVRSATRAALATRSERRRLNYLLALSGVSVPMASSILMLLNPKRYGVIDIRVWAFLHRLGTVSKNRSGVGFTFGNWYQFLMIVRYFADKFGCNARDVERALFEAHKAFQKGRLYGNRS